MGDGDPPARLTVKGSVKGSRIGDSSEKRTGDGEVCQAVSWRLPLINGHDAKSLPTQMRIGKHCEGGILKFNTGAEIVWPAWICMLRVKWGACEWSVMTKEPPSNGGWSRGNDGPNLSTTVVVDASWRIPTNSRTGWAAKEPTRNRGREPTREPKGVIEIIKVIQIRRCWNLLLLRQETRVYCY